MRQLPLPSGHYDAHEKNWYALACAQHASLRAHATPRAMAPYVRQCAVRNGVPAHHWATPMQLRHRPPPLRAPCESNPERQARLTQRLRERLARPRRLICGVRRSAFLRVSASCGVVVSAALAGCGRGAPRIWRSYCYLLQKYQARSLGACLVVGLFSCRCSTCSRTLICYQVQE